MEIFWSEKLNVPNEEDVRAFLQLQANRIMNGHCRYGPPKKSKLYLKRLRIEIREYAKTGNFEHLINAAVYCWLESMAPQNKKFHFDNTVDSVTRGVVEKRKHQPFEYDPKDGGPRK